MVMIMCLDSAVLLFVILTRLGDVWSSVSMTSLVAPVFGLVEGLTSRLKIRSPSGRCGFE